MNLPKATIEQLLEAGVHFGHNVRRWNPKMEQYIFGARNKIHIIDLRITLPLIDVALSKLHEIVSKSGKVLIVGTKKLAGLSAHILGDPFMPTRLNTICWFLHTERQLSKFLRSALTKFSISCWDIPSK